jgi:hypothetical protein
MKEFKFGSFWSDVNPMFHEVQTEPSGLKMAHRTKNGMLFVYKVRV